MLLLHYRLVVDVHRIRIRTFIYSELKTGIYSCSLSDSTIQYEQFQSDSLAKNKLSIAVSLQGTVVYAAPEQGILSISVNTANACKCQETTFSTADSISSIAIITLRDFDSSHVAGSDVTTYFEVPEYDYSNSKTAIIQKPITSYFQYSYSGYSPGFFLNIYLSQFPQNKGYAKFLITITCKNGKEFKAETKKIYLF